MEMYVHSRELERSPQLRIGPGSEKKIITIRRDLVENRSKKDPFWNGLAS